MNSYEGYETEDFLKDNFFVEWVLVPKQEHIEFWDNWLKENTQNKAAALSAKQILKAIRVVPVKAGLSDLEISSVIENAYDQRYNAAASHKKDIHISFNKLFFRIAATLLIILAAGYFIKNLYWPAPSQKHLKNELAVSEIADSVKIYNHTTTPRVIRMKDGSLAILSPNSKLSYPAKFNEKVREVVLDGEAFFEIHHDDSKSFLIYSDAIITRDLGTSFTIKSFAGENEYSVIVNTGKVQVYRNGAKNKDKDFSYIVLPNQQITFRQKESKFKEDTLTKALPLSNEQASKIFTFNNTPFNEVITKLEGIYHVPIMYDKSKFDQYTITASLSKLPLDEKMTMICRAVNAHCNLEDGIITIN